MKEYVVYGEESGEMKGFKTLKEAKEFIKDIKRFDKENESLTVKGLIFNID